MLADRDKVIDRMAKMASDAVNGVVDDLQRRLAEAEAQLHTAEDAWCRERDAMSAKIIGMEAQLAEEREKRRKALEAIKPFGDAVFNDNGDVTLALSHIRTQDYMKARALLSSPEARKVMAEK
jgi:hypothetical protein